MVSTTSYPAMLIIKEAKISSIHTDYGYGIRSKLYYVVKMSVLFNSNWASIELWITVIELKEMIQKVTNTRLRNLIERELFERNKGCIDIKGWLAAILHQI